VNEEDLRQHQTEVRKRLKGIKEPHTVKVSDLDIIVFPGVFPPTTDTRLIAGNIRVSDGDRVLDLTTGSGALAAIAGSQGASGVAVDINPEAVKNAQENFKRLGVNMTVLESDLFSKVPEEQFDLIIANGPYLEGEVKDPLETAFFGAKNFIENLLGNASRYLKDTGRILITFAEWGDIDMFERIAKNNNFELKVLGNKSSKDGERTYRLYELKPNRF